MDWMLFWTAFGAIGGTVGALATAGAVIVALWQTKYAQRKKLKVKFDDKGVAVSNIGTRLLEFISLTVTNVGNREVIIERWGFELKDNREMLIFSELPMRGIPSNLQDSFRNKFPHVLQIEQRTTFYYEKALFLALVQEHCSHGELDPKKPIRFFAKDTTGRKYYCKTLKKAGEYKNANPTLSNEVK